MTTKIIAAKSGDDNLLPSKPLPSLTDLADWILLFLEAAEAEDQADLLISLWRQTGLSWRNFSTLITLSLQSQRGGNL
ncbi:hypothetical protein AB3R30_25275 [Leptolyngbyaceae cyanobacterium UHCC 1019]